MYVKRIYIIIGCYSYNLSTQTYTNLENINSWGKKWLKSRKARVEVMRFMMLLAAPVLILTTRLTLICNFHNASDSGSDHDPNDV